MGGPCMVDGDPVSTEPSSPTPISLAARLRSGARIASFGGLLAATQVRWDLEKRRLTPEGREARKDELRKEVSGRVLQIFGVELHLSGKVPPRRGPRLVVANHRAALDIGILLHELGGTFLSRSDLAGWPIVGRLAEEADTIFVDREDRVSGASAIRAIRRQLKAGASVMIFPEGKTFTGDEVRRFHAGAFVAARGLDAEIVPVGLAYPPGTEYVGVTFVEHVEALARRRRTPVGVAIGRPFTAEGKTAVLAERAHRAVQELVLEARRSASR